MSGKDRTGMLIIEEDADILYYFIQGNTFSRLTSDDQSDRDTFIDAYLSLFLSGHHQLLASSNAPGSLGLKAVNEVLPPDIYAKLSTIKGLLATNKFCSSLNRADKKSIKHKIKAMFNKKKTVQLTIIKNPALHLQLRPEDLKTHAHNIIADHSTSLSEFESGHENFQLLNKLTEKIKLPGLIFEKIPADGHCLYHAVSLYFHQGDNQQDFRNRVAEKLENNRAEFFDFIYTPDRNFDYYITAVRSGKQWADHLEIEILMRIFQRPIVIINPDLTIDNQEVIQRFDNEPIFVRYNGVDHYDAYVLDGSLTGREIIALLANFQHVDNLSNQDSATETSTTDNDESESTNELRPLLGKRNNK